VLIRTSALGTGWEGVDWIQLARDMVHWLDFVNTVMNLLVSKIRAITSLVEKLLASREGLCFTESNTISGSTFCGCVTTNNRRGSSVSTVTVLRAAQLEGRSSILGRGRGFSLFYNVHTFLGPTKSSSVWVQRALPLVREADHSPASITEIKNAWRCTSTLPYVFVALYLSGKRLLPIHNASQYMLCYRPVYTYIYVKKMYNIIFRRFHVTIVVVEKQ
jgi:hypothetical protein